MNALFSADSHVVEIEACYAEIDPKWRSRRPEARDDPKQGAIMVVPGMDFTIPSGMLSRAGLRFEDWAKPQPWSRIHPAAYDPKARLAVQDEENVGGEIIYPSAGMVLCLHKDVAYRKACFEAYNRWLAAFCATDPKRLVGIAMVALPSPEEGVRELKEAARQGFKGVMFCGDPAFDDYDHPSYAPIWEMAIELGLPVSFHILTGKDSYGMAVRGPKVIQQIVTVRGNQNIIMMMVLGGVFERHPDLKVVMVENDAGWLPHFCFRLDHAWERHRWSMEIGSISRKPSEYVHENVYTTFQDDSSVRWVIDALNLDHVMWATDFPHGDGTYPNSRRIADEVTVGMTPEQKRGVVEANVRSLYGL
jgi:predicted TIM-barrel fold metal-dependent hydrolase